MNFKINRTNFIKYTVDTAFDNNFNISVQNGEVIVSAPWYLSNTQIQEAVLERKKWILNKIKEYQINIELAKITNKKIIDRLKSKNIILLGQTYQTKIYYKNIKFPEINFKKNIIEIILPKGYKNKNITRIINLIINKIYSSYANKTAEAIMEKVRIEMDLAPENYEIKPLKNILGICLNNNTIILSLELFKYNPEIIEYIIIHEFCHLKYKNHTKSFYNMLKKYAPNYEELSKNINNMKY